MVADYCRRKENNMQAYSNPERENDAYSLPDIEVFELTAEEAVVQDEDLMWQAMKRFPLATMNSREREKAIAWAIEESGTTGGWFWWACFPGCDGPAMGPFKTHKEALKDARESYEE
jgi:hypothetical protein